MSRLDLDALNAVLARTVKTVNAGAAPGAERALSDLGINSLEILNIMIAVAGEHDIDLGRLADVTVQPCTVGDLLALLQEAQS